MTPYIDDNQHVDGEKESADKYCSVGILVNPAGKRSPVNSDVDKFLLIACIEYLLLQLRQGERWRYGKRINM